GIVLLVCLLFITLILLQERQTIRQQAAGGTIPQFSHVFVIVEENKDYKQIIGSSAAPYINQLANQYGSAANFVAEAHPSLPNYIALTSGNTQGIIDDCNTCFVNANSIFQELEQAKKTWKSYHEDMTSNCLTSDTSLYVMHHNPAAYYTPIKASCAVNDVPYSQFASDLASNKTGNLTFIIPNNNNEMHDGTIQQGDAWLQKNLPAILNSSAYKQNGLIVLTWDEDSDSGGNNQIATILISSLVKKGFKSSVQYNHYSLLRTLSDGLGVQPLGLAATASPMADFFDQSANSNPVVSGTATILPSPAVSLIPSPATSVSAVPNPQCLGTSCISPVASVSAAPTLIPSVPTGATNGSGENSGSFFQLLLLFFKALFALFGFH
ncbi:MAG: alkaline phosphatase family protein, partial [Candidatus Levyibacteriota bacterium]